MISPATKCSTCRSFAPMQKVGRERHRLMASSKMFDADWPTCQSSVSSQFISALSPMSIWDMRSLRIKPNDVHPTYGLLGCGITKTRSPHLLFYTMNGIGLSQEPGADWRVGSFLTQRVFGEISLANCHGLAMSVIVMRCRRAITTRDSGC